MDVMAGSIADARGIDFGYLGCREAVVPFHVACGWVRIVAAERSIDRHGRAVCAEPYQHILVTRRTWLESENRRLGPSRGEGDLGEEQL